LVVVFVCCLRVVTAVVAALALSGTLLRVNLHMSVMHGVRLHLQMIAKAPPVRTRIAPTASGRPGR
jgi:hypothetical protein